MPLRITIPCDITRVASGRAFCNTKRRDSLQNDVFVFISIMQNIDNYWSKKFRPYKMACLEKHNFIPNHPKAMSKTKMTKNQITTKWHYWNVPKIANKTCPRKNPWIIYHFYFQAISYKMVCSDTCLYMHILACLCLRLSWSDLYALETNYLIQVQSKCSVPTPPPDCDKFFVKSSSTGHRFFFWVSPISDVMSKELWGIPINPQDWSPGASMCTPKKSFTVWGHQKKIKSPSYLTISSKSSNASRTHTHTQDFNGLSSSAYRNCTFVFTTKWPGQDFFWGDSLTWFYFGATHRDQKFIDKWSWLSKNSWRLQEGDDLFQKSQPPLRTGFVPSNPLPHLHASWSKACTASSDVMSQELYGNVRHPHQLWDWSPAASWTVHSCSLQNDQAKNIFYFLGGLTNLILFWSNKRGSIYQWLSKNSWRLQEGDDLFQKSQPPLPHGLCLRQTLRRIFEQCMHGFTISLRVPHCAKPEQSERSIKTWKKISIYKPIYILNHIYMMYAYRCI